MSGDEPEAVPVVRYLLWLGFAGWLLLSCLAVPLILDDHVGPWSIASCGGYLLWWPIVSCGVPLVACAAMYWLAKWSLDRVRRD